MHTDHTLKIIEELTAILGNQLRLFAIEICSNYDTFELPKEARARRRRKSKKSTAELDEIRGTAQQRVTFNMDTYKHHALGDYVQTIRTYGTCDSYSTEPVCARFMNC